MLNSVTYGGKTRSDLMLVSYAQVSQNVWGPPGVREPNCVISTGMGRNATIGLISGCADGTQLASLRQSESQLDQLQQGTW
jgi:hypothetical protein